MKRSKYIEYAIGFSRLALDMGIDPEELGDLAERIRRSVGATAEYLSRPEAPDHAGDRREVERQAQRMGLTVSWDAITPTLRRDRDGITIRMPVWD